MVAALQCFVIEAFKDVLSVIACLSICGKAAHDPRMSSLSRDASFKVWRHLDFLVYQWGWTLQAEGLADAVRALQAELGRLEGDDLEAASEREALATSLATVLSRCLALV